MDGMIVGAPEFTKVYKVINYQKSFFLLFFFHFYFYFNGERIHSYNEESSNLQIIIIRNP